MPHNLKEVAQAIYDTIDGKEATLPGPDFPTGGIIINKDDIPNIMKTGHGTIKLRGKYIIENNNNIVFIEIPYEVETESLMEQIGKASDEEVITGIKDIRNESNKKGFRLVIECDKNANLKHIINQLFKETDLQTSISYNQVALIDKVPTEMNLKDCLDIYIKHNSECIVREAEFDINKTTIRIHILDGLIKAMGVIDQIINLIRNANDTAAAKSQLISTFGFDDEQAKAILDMKLSRLAKLEAADLQKEKNDLTILLAELNQMKADPIPELKKRLQELVDKYGDDRRTELTQLAAPTKEDKAIEKVEPEKCVVIMAEDGTIKRIPSASFKVQKRNGKGVKSPGDITAATIRTNTIDSLMVFTNKGRMYRILVDEIPEGTNATKGKPIKSLIEMESDEIPTLIYSIYRDTDAKFILFVTRDGIVKRTPLDEYIGTKRKNGINAITLREEDNLVSVNLIKDEDIILLTASGAGIKFKSSEVPIAGRTASGVKGMGLKDGDAVVCALIVRDNNDCIAVFSEKGLGKKINIKELPNQKRGGKGLLVYKPTIQTGDIVAGALINDNDIILVNGVNSSICISGSDIPTLSRNSIGTQIIKGTVIASVSKV